MKTRLLLATLSVLCTLSANAQRTGTFYLDKTTFAPNEPIFLHFKVLNPRPQEASPREMESPQQPLCSGYFIQVSRNPPDAPSCEMARSSPFDVCNMDGPMVGPPGKSFSQRILLNLDSQLNVPGEYSIHAKYVNMHGPEDEVNAEVTVHLRVDAAAPAPSRAVFQPWVNRLHSRDDWKRAEAVEVLSNVAPRSLERLLIGFASDPDLRWSAPVALHRLNTPRSIAALAALLQGPMPKDLREDNALFAAKIGNPSWPPLLADSAKEESALYLAETGDQRWLPVLFNAAKRYRDRAYLSAAAELGGDKAVPTLVAISKEPDRKYASIAVRAMASSGSRAAVPYLLEYLKSPEASVAESANASLEWLTHRRASTGQRTATQADYSKWSQWWSREGASAPIYKAGDPVCDAFRPLP